jgi:hypothetical protein
MVVDQDSQNNGAVSSNSLTFGAGSGEGIASKRTGGGNQWGLDFYTSFQPRMTIANNGNVGIGTTSPSAKLEVNGAVNAQSFNGTAGTLFTLGTTDNQPLEFKVNNQRALRLEPTGFTDTVNVIGGSARNVVGVRAVGATIGGGGAGNWDGFSYTNRVEADFGTVSGGAQNTIESPTPNTRPSAEATQTTLEGSAIGRPSAAARVTAISGAVRPSVGAYETRLRPAPALRPSAAASVTTFRPTPTLRRSGGVWQTRLRPRPRS